MSEMMERPELRKRGPRPASDEGVDPVDVPKPAEKEPETAENVVVIPRKKREPLFPFSTRLSENALNTIEVYAAQEGLPQRAAVEYAISLLGKRIKKSQ